METIGEQHLYEIQVYLDDLAPDAVQVELYAEGMEDRGPVRQEMKRDRQLVGASGGYVYSASVSAARSPSDYTARVIPQLRWRCGSPGSLSHPVAARVDSGFGLRVDKQFREINSQLSKNEVAFSRISEVQGACAIRIRSCSTSIDAHVKSPAEQLSGLAPEGA